MDNNTIDLEALNKSLGALVKSVIEEGKIQAIIKQQYPCLHEAVEAYRSEVVRINAGLPKSVWDSLKEPKELTPVEKLLAGQKITTTIGDKSFDVVLEASFEDIASNEGEDPRLAHKEVYQTGKEGVSEVVTAPVQPIEVVKSNRLDTNPLDNGTFDV